MNAPQEMLSKMEAVRRGDVTLAELQGITAEHARLIGQIGCELASVGRLEEAKIIFKGLVATNPKDSGAHSALGTILQKLGQKEEALAAYDLALKEDAHNPIALANRGELRLRTGDSEGLEDLRRAVAEDSGMTTSAARRARALIKAISLPADGR